VFVKVFNRLKLLNYSNINWDINKKEENFEKNSRGIEKCCTFAPAELKEGLPLKMI